MIHIEPRFDQSLLDATPERKIAYFRGKVLQHQHLSQAHALAMDNIEFASKGELVAIAGPSGVGTTELARRLWREYQQMGNDANEGGSARTNANSIGITAPSQAGRIDVDYLKRIFAEIMQRGGDLLSDHKLYCPPSEFTLMHSIPHADPLKKGVDTLLNSTVSMLNRRQTKLVLINQADRLFPESDSAGSNRSQQVLMDMAAQTDARIVLIGNYQLVHASCARNNWLRRQHMVHLRRYDRKIKSEYVDFVQVLKNLLANLPTERRLKVLTEEFAMKLYVSCVGCIGTLKKTLHMALQHALRTDEDMTDALILSYALPNSVALQILREARIGEHLLTDIGTTEVEKMLDDDLPPLDGQEDAKPSKRSPKISDGKKPGFRGGRIGERKPTRDPVGGRHGQPR